MFVWHHEKRWPMLERDFGVYEVAEEGIGDNSDFCLESLPFASVLSRLLPEPSRKPVV